MASDLLQSYIQQFSHNTAEIVSTTTKIPTIYGSKTVIAMDILFSLLLSREEEYSCKRRSRSPENRMGQTVSRMWNRVVVAVITGIIHVTIFK